MPLFKYTTPGLSRMTVPVPSHARRDDTVWVKANCRLEVNETLSDLLLQEVTEEENCRKLSPATPEVSGYLSDETTPNAKKASNS